MKNKATVICASGFGDGLLMMIAARRLQEVGYDVTVQSDAHTMLAPLFDGVAIQPFSGIDGYDKIVVENDNSKRCWDILEKRPAGCHFIFPTLSKRLDAYVSEEDYVCTGDHAMAHHIAKAMESWTGIFSKGIGIFRPEAARYQMVQKRVVIHPTSRDPIRNWSKHQFLSLAQNLSYEGFHPAFCVGPDEDKDWGDFAVPKLDSMQELASFIYEAGYFIGNDSGLGHLASALGVPTLTISGNPKRVKLWRPNWHDGDVVTPKIPLPNFKGIGIRWRDNYWQPFVSSVRTLSAFRRLCHEEAIEPVLQEALA